MPSEIKYIDIHTHNIYSQKHILSIYNISDINNSTDILNKSDYLSAGLHPWYITDNYPGNLKKLEQLSANKKTIAIGECGIDKIKGPEPETQKKIFKSQIAISEELKKPLIIHAVKAYDEILNLHKKHNPEMPWIIHGFNGNYQQAEQFYKKNIYLSVGEILFNEKSRLRKSINKLNTDFLFFETDASDKNIEDIYVLYCKLCNINKEKISSIIKRNFKKCFKIWD